MKQVQASIIRIVLQSDKYISKPYPKSLYVMSSLLVGEGFAFKGEAHKKYVPPLFHPYLVKWTASKEKGTEAIIEISSLDETATNYILASLEKMPFINLGRGNLKVEEYFVKKQEVLSLKFEENAPVPNEFKIVFETPTHFRQRLKETYITKAYPDLKLTIRSIARNLHLLFKIPISLDDQNAMIKQVIVLNVLGSPIKAKLCRYYPYDDAFIGEIQLSCERLTDHQKRVFGLMLMFTRYLGVGFNKGYGYGHISIRPIKK